MALPYLDCEICKAYAHGMAEENWLDDKKLRTYIGDGRWQISRELTLAEEAEITQWAESLLSPDFYDIFNPIHEEYHR